MTRCADRVAVAVAVPGGVALGDPTGVHVLLSPDSVEHRRGDRPEALDVLAWDRVLALEVEAPTTRVRGGLGVAALVAVAAESVGLDWTPRIAPVVVLVALDGRLERWGCDGYAGRGYRRAHLDVLEAGLHVWATHPESRAGLAAPSSALADLEANAGRSAEEMRPALAAAWGATCACG